MIVKSIPPAPIFVVVPIKSLAEPTLAIFPASPTKTVSGILEPVLKSESFSVTNTTPPTLPFFNVGKRPKLVPIFLLFGKKKSPKCFVPIFIKSIPFSSLKLVAKFPPKTDIKLTEWPTLTFAKTRTLKRTPVPQSPPLRTSLKEFSIAVSPTVITALQISPIFPVPPRICKLLVSEFWT